MSFLFLFSFLETPPSFSCCHRRLLSFSFNWNPSFLWRCIYGSFFMPWALHGGRGNTYLSLLSHCCFQTMLLYLYVKYAPPLKSTPSGFTTHYLFSIILQMSYPPSLVLDCLWLVFLLLSQHTGQTASGPLLRLSPFPESLFTKKSAS